MTRMLALVAALFMTALTVSSAVAAGNDTIRFAIEPASQGERIRLSAQRGDADRKNGNWSAAFDAGDVEGLDRAAVRGTANSPVRFSIVRDAGRFDCSGSGGQSRASGLCRFTENAAFRQALTAGGMTAPTSSQALGFVILDVRRELVEALASANYRASADDLLALTAVGVTPAYIRDLASQGYRPAKIGDLVAFGALKITPEYIGSFSRAGYGDLDGEDLLQLKALEITPAYIAGFERVGYGRLPVEALLKLKALGVTPDFARSMATKGELPNLDRLVMLKALGRAHR